MSIKNKWMIIISFFAILIADALSKYWTQMYVSRHFHQNLLFSYTGIPIFENWMGIQFSIVHATNKGMAWGFLSNFPNFLLVTRILLIIGMSLYLFKEKMEFKFQLPLAMIIAGALGNVLDAVFYGHVIDMLSFVFWGYHFPVFNLADSAIFCGVAYIFLQSFCTKTIHCANG